MTLQEDTLDFMWSPCCLTFYKKLTEVPIFYAVVTTQNFRSLD